MGLTIKARCADCRYPASEHHTRVLATWPIRRWGIPVATVIGDGVSCTVNNLGRFSLWLRPKKRASAKYLNRQIELLPGETYVWPGNTVYVVVKRR